MEPPLPVDANLYWNQGLLDVWFEYATRSDRSKFAIHPKLDRLGTRVVTVLRFLRRAVRFVRSSTPAIRVWSDSIRSGGRRRGGSYPSGSATFSTVATTCSSSCAW
jgi:hypothetical protein